MANNVEALRAYLFCPFRAIHNSQFTIHNSQFTFHSSLTSDFVIRYSLFGIHKTSLFVILYS